MPVLSIDQSTLTVSERAGMANIGLKLSGPKTGDIVVTYATSITDSDTAQQADFTAASTTATISSLSTTGVIPNIYHQ